MSIFHLLQKHPQLDSRRIYVTGHSNGAMMAYRIAGALSELITAASSVSGTIGGQEEIGAPVFVILHPKEPVSILHGKLDYNVPIEGGIGLIKRVDLSMKQSLEFWLKGNQCVNQSSISWSRNGKISLERFDQCAKAAQVMGYIFQNQGHFWMDMNNEVRKEEFYGKSLAESIWNLIKHFNKIHFP